MSARGVWFVCVCLALLSSVQVFAQDVPPYLTQQGRLIDANNQPVNAVEDLIFTIYDGPDPGAAVLWTETRSVNISGGYYSVVLGQIDPLPLPIFDGTTRYMGVTVVSEGVELTPRMEIYSVPYAIKAGVAQNAVGALTPSSVTVGNTVIDASGIHVNGQTVIDPSGQWAGSAPAVSVGAGLTGDGTDAAPLALDTSALATVASSGSYDDLTGLPLTFSNFTCSDGEVPQMVGGAWACVPASSADTLSGLACADGQIAKQSGGVWGCADDADTTYSASPTGGITISAANDLAVDTAFVQSRVFGVCSDGFSIRQINADGSVICEPDTDTDTDTTYTAGAGLTLSGTAFSVDATQTQARVAGACLAGESIRAIAQDGSVTCEPDTDTTYAAGAGLTLSGTTFALKESEQFMRGSQLSTADATLSGMALSTDRLVLTQGGYGSGTTDLVVNAANSPYVLGDGVHEFRNLTVEVGGTLTAAPWNGYAGGRIEIRATGTVSIAGTVNLKGRGYRGGTAYNINNMQQWIPLTTPGQPGESWSGEGNDRLPQVVNGGGGAGGGVDTCSYGAGGGGGGYATAGTTAASVGGGCTYGLTVQGGSFTSFAASAAQGGVGGAVYGDTAITQLYLGSGGGASGSDSDCAGQRGGHGGNGGGAIRIQAQTISITGTIDVSGNVGGNAFDAVDPCGYSGNNGGGGGGSGGSVHLQAGSVTLSAAAAIRGRGGAGGTQLGSSTDGGVGGDGRIRIEGTSVANAGTLDVATAASASVVSGATFGRGDATAGAWISPLISYTGTGRFKQVDLFANKGEATFLHAHLCTGTVAADTTNPANCRPVSPSGAVDAPPNAGFARIRLAVVDRSPTKSFALFGVRTTFGD